MNMTKKNVKWTPKLSIIYENKTLDDSIKSLKSINKKIKNKFIKNKKNEINDLIIEYFEF